MIRNDGITRIGQTKSGIRLHTPVARMADIAYLCNNSGKVQIGGDWYLQNFGTLGTSWWLRAYNAVIDGNIPTENITLGVATYAGCIGDTATSRRFVSDAALPSALGHGSYTFELIWYDRGGKNDIEAAQTNRNYFAERAPSLWFIWHNAASDNLAVASADGCGHNGWTNNNYWSGTGARHLLVSLNAATGVLTRCLNGAITASTGQSPVTTTNSIKLSVLGSVDGHSKYVSASTICRMSIWQGFAATSTQLTKRKNAVYAGTADVIRWAEI